ncbi:MAG: restriction endonuclease subunit S [Candidatus Poribacteria bacterium]|nr:restriction endonuclease subunit S [Candidatus Poribacteria bacterium]
MGDNKIREIRQIRENPRFRRYPKYKESGVEWIGEIPRHWEVKRLKHVAEILPSNVDKHIYPDEIQVRLCNYTDVYYNDYITVDTVLERGSCKEREFTKFILRKGNVIITKDSETPDDIGVPTFVKDDLDNVVCGYHLTMIRPYACLGEFIFRFIQSDRTRRYFEVNSNGITRYGLGKSSIENLLLPIPSDSEQAQIADFLDRKTKQIDALIRIKERWIELLQEQRTALINQVVTKGLDPSVEMKPSGVEWIGEIPKDWILTRLKYISNIPVTYGLNIESDKYTTEGIRLIRITDIGEGGNLEQKGVYLSEDCVPQEQMLNSYDLLLSRSGATVGKSYLHLEAGKYASAGYLVRFNFDDYWTSKFIYYVTLSHFYRNWLEQQIITSTIQNVNGEKYSNFQLPIPSYREHKQIVSFLDHKTKQIAELISTEQRKIELLKKYRQSLISEAVTGKIDVRNVG